MTAIADANSGVTYFGGPSSQSPTAAATATVVTATVTATVVTAIATSPSRLPSPAATATAIASCDIVLTKDPSLGPYAYDHTTISSFLNIAEVGAFASLDGSGANLLLGKACSSSSVYGTYSDWHCGRAVDGDVSTLYHSGNEDSSPSLYITATGVSMFGSIVVQPRSGFGSRIGGVMVSLMQSQTNTVLWRAQIPYVVTSSSPIVFNVNKTCTSSAGRQLGTTTIDLNVAATIISPVGAITALNAALRSSTLSTAITSELAKIGYYGVTASVTKAGGDDSGSTSTSATPESPAGTFHIVIITAISCSVVVLTCCLCCCWRAFLKAAKSAVAPSAAPPLPVANVVSPREVFAKPPPPDPSLDASHAGEWRDVRPTVARAFRSTVHGGAPGGTPIKNICSAGGAEGVSCNHSYVGPVPHWSCCGGISLNAPCLGKNRESEEKRIVREV